MTSQQSASAALTVDLGDRSYPIHIAAGVLDSAGETLMPVLRQNRVFVVSDTNVAPLYLERVIASFEAAGVTVTSHVVPAGEATKNFAELESLVEAMLAAKVERATAAVALGGGVVGDLTGFAAATTLRGMDFIQIPTTLLAQVDSSVGGKTGINTRHGKNLAGSFHQPKAVLIDIETLKTLPQRELGAGYAEVCKYGLINDAAFWSWLEANGQKVLSGDKAALTHAISVSCRAKAKIVAEDEKESSVRALLNLGHTFGHALEAELGYSGELLHGEAVAIGILMAFDLSVRLGRCPKEDADRIRAHFEHIQLPTAPPRAASLDADVLLAHMSQDKKVKDGALTLILANGIGDAFITRDVETKDVKAVLEAALAV